MTKQRIAQILVTLIVGVASVQLTSVGAAQAAPLTDLGWSVSKAHPGDTAARYSWNFTTATTGTIATITFSVPTGTAGAALTVVDNYGVGVGTAALAGTTVTYTVTSPVSVAAGTPILVSIDGFTNTSTAGTNSSTVTTRTSVPATIDTATTNSITFDSNTTALTVVIARTIAFTNNKDSILFLMDPGLPALADRRDTTTSLAIATNATSGYTLSARSTVLTGGAGQTLPAVTAGTGTGVADGAFTTNRWGFTVPAVTNGGGGSLTRAGQLASGEFVGHMTTNQTIATQTAPTNGDTVPVTVRAKIDYLQPATTYNSTITYTAAPNY